MVYLVQKSNLYKLLESKDKSKKPLAFEYELLKMGLVGISLTYL